MTTIDESTRSGSSPAIHAEDMIACQSTALKETVVQLERVAPTNTTVLITGETGTGKELMARLLHRRSRRAGRPMVTVNLASLPEALVAAEFFGHEKGAFTGALQRRIGRFEMGDRGTLFLDEVGELSLDIQVALLRVLQEGQFERLGASETRRVDVRLICATNRNLEQDVEDGRFREDLFYRLSVFPIHLPPLRERREDIPLLAGFLLARLASRLGRHFTGIDEDSVARLQDFSWPGNIRQLENVLEHSAILCDGPLLDVPSSFLTRKRGAQSAPALNTVLQESQLDMIEKALAKAEGRVSGPAGAAARLGIPASTLESKIRRFRIDKLRYRMTKLD